MSDWMPVASVAAIAAAKPTRMWLDCEFNGYQGALLSIALVAEDDACFYGRVWCAEPIDPWVAEHVLPVMQSAATPLVEVQDGLREFLCGFPQGVEIVADWPDDFAYFCRALLTGPGTRLKPLPPITMVLRLDLSSEGAVVPHNALSDAFAIRADYLSKETT